MSRPPFETFKRATCKGSYVFNSACGNCERCAWEREEMNRTTQVAAAPAKPRRDPTPEELESPAFNAVWSVIKSWDIGRDGLRAGATGSDVCEILDALRADEPAKAPWCDSARAINAEHLAKFIDACTIGNSHGEHGVPERIHLYRLANVINQFVSKGTETLCQPI